MLPSIITEILSYPFHLDYCFWIVQYHMCIFTTYVHNELRTSTFYVKPSMRTTSLPVCAWFVMLNISNQPYCCRCEKTIPGLPACTHWCHVYFCCLYVGMHAILFVDCEGNCYTQTKQKLCVQILEYWLTLKNICR